MKKIISVILVLLISFFMTESAFANVNESANVDESANVNENANDNTENNSSTFSAGIDDEVVFLNPKSTYVLETESDIDINDTKENDEIFFRLVSKVQASNGMYLPEHTRFAGKFKKVKKSEPLFKRAKAYILIDKIIFPNEKIYTVRMEPKKGSSLKSSQFLNTLRALPAGIGIVTFSIISVAVVAIESVTVVGLVVVPRTCRGFGLLISSMAKGLNYKLKAGSKIIFKLDTPAYVQVSDILSK